MNNAMNIKLLFYFIDNVTEAFVRESASHLPGFFHFGIPKPKNEIFELLIL